MSLGDWLRQWLSRPPPSPSFENVIPAGAGWYKWSRSKGKWRRCEVRGFDPEARWLSHSRLLDFALDAIIALKGRKRRRV